MAANQSQRQDPIPNTITTTTAAGSEEKPVEPDNLKERPLPAKNETLFSPNFSQDAATIGHQRDNTGQLGPFGSAGDFTVYPSNVYAPQAQAFYYRGYKNAIGEWDDYPYVNAEGLEMGSSGVYNENGSILFHAGYGYGPQMPYGPYSPVTTPLPSVGGDAQLYNPQQFPFSGPPYYQHFGPPSTPYITSPTPVSQSELNALASIDQQGDNMVFGPRPSYPPFPGSSGRGSFPGNLGTIGFHDLQPGFDGLRSTGVWSDWSKPSNRHRPLTPLSPAVSPQPLGQFGSYGQNTGMASQQQRSFYGVASGSNPYTRGYMHGGFNQVSGFGSASVSSLGANNRGGLSFENSRRRGRASISLCGCNDSLDILSEQNRGPRSSKSKCQNTSEHTAPVDNNKYSKLTAAKIHDGSYNQPDFVTEYKDAKFFIIKSYSEDNVHKSIKYGVWASTPNGNRKLDAAYREAKEKQVPCSVFLFFSVNASAQFCGAAEMVGAVDFDKSVDYWQQDKWSGQFPVEWHVIKDVPNSQFRHIVLENNENKPVTNSRDTQEVKMEQGVEMLSIFKSCESETSILDDFEFYEEREKAMQERKARQQMSMNMMMMGGGVVRVGVGDGEVEERRNAEAGELMSKSFAQVVRLDDGGKRKEGTVNVNVNERGSCVSESECSARVKVEKDAVVSCGPSN